MDPINIGALAAAVIAAAASWATGRAAGKASKESTQIGGRLDAEKEAYERARQFDLETIDRQAAELVECRKEIENLKTRLKALEDRTPIAVLGLEGLLRDRAKEEPGSDQKQ